MRSLDTRSLSSPTFARRNFGCDHCGAAPGSKCINATGAPIREVHAARLASARPFWLPLFEAARAPRARGTGTASRHEVFEIGTMRIGAARFPRVRCSCGVEAIATRGLASWTELHLAGV